MPASPPALLLAALLAAPIASAIAAEPDAPTPAAAPDLAGTWFGSLPLDGCGRGEVLLQLQDDGDYLLQAHCAATLAAQPPERGRWTIEWNGTCLRLSPVQASVLASAPPVKELALPLDDLLVLTDGSCIEPVDDPRGRSLHRARTDAAPAPEGG